MDEKTAQPVAPTQSHTNEKQDSQKPSNLSEKQKEHSHDRSEHHHHHLKPTLQDPSQALKNTQSKLKGPPGGFDPSTVPHAPPGYTVKITFHRATNLPVADLPSLSSDPYLHATLETSLPTRHNTDPPLSFRSRTIFRELNPQWEEYWILEHVPANGFKMKVQVYDEDRGDRDDRLGNVHVDIGRISENWAGVHNAPYKIEKRVGSKRAYLLRALAVCMGQAKHMNGELYVSVEVLGRSPGQEGGRAYTLGPCYWCKHYSPLLGRITNSKVRPNESDSSDEDELSTADKQEPTGNVQDSAPGKAIPGAKYGSRGRNAAGIKRQKRRKVSTYNFQANQFQLRGPVPQELYHRFVEFKPFIKALFTSSGIRGLLLNKALKHQHAQVYNFNRHTKYGVFDQPCEAMTQRFLDLCHYDDGGRIFTYVISLDGLMRFTETGKEFGIDMLSKHTMHSDASSYIAYSGEFFIRKRRCTDGHHHRHPPPLDPSAEQEPQIQPSSGTDQEDEQIQSTVTTGRLQPEHAQLGEIKSAATEAQTQQPRQSSGPPNAHDPCFFELVIDNDSGTYRPNASLLPILHDFLTANFPGLKILMLDSQSDAELMGKLKSAQREKKKAARERRGEPASFRQPSSTSSSSSSSAVSVNSQEGDALAGGIDPQGGSNDNDQPEASSSAAAANSAKTNGKTKDEHGQNQQESREDGPRKPKHKIDEVILPFIGEGKLRDKLMTPDNSP